LLEDTGEETLGSKGEFEVGFVEWELVECIEVLQFVTVEEPAALLFGVPELNVLGNCVLLLSVSPAVIPKQGFSFLNVLSDVLSNALKAWEVGLPLVGYPSLVFVYGTDALGEFLIGLQFTKKTFERHRRDGFA